jgi:alkylated DNA repair dioxygenase AlkB
MNATDIVDLDRYPIAELDAPAGRAALARDGLALMPGFLRGAALAAMRAEADALAPGAYFKESMMTASGGDGAYPVPLPRPSRLACAAISYDRLAPSSPMRRLYEWDGLIALFRALLGTDRLHRCADPYISCLLMIYRPGDELGWHFDPNDGIVTLLVEDAEEGGDFEVAPRVGRDGGAAIEAVMAGGREDVVAPDLRPGTLALFKGMNALHRVTPVARGRRAMLTLSFHPEPGKQFSSAIRRQYTGRDV